MSDRFNETVNKQRILDILKVNNKASLPVESYFPPFFRLKQDYPKGSDYQRWFEEAGIIVYKPQAVPSMTSINVMPLLNPGLDPLIEEVGKERELPWGEKEFFMKYTPHHFSMDYDLKLLKQVIHFWIEDTNSEDYTVPVEQCVKTVKEKAFCTGTYEGQVARLKHIYDLANGLNGKRKPVSVFKLLMHSDLEKAGLNKFEAFCDVFSDYLPLNAAERFLNPAGPLKGYNLQPGEDLPDGAVEEDNFVELDPRFPGLYDPPSYFVNIYTDMDFLPPIGSNKMFGTPYIGETKGDKIPEALVLADSLFHSTSDIIKETPFEGNSFNQGYRVPHIYSYSVSSKQNRLKTLMKDFWFLGAGPLFPKAERYDQADVRKKTRNIFAASFPLHIICGLVSNPVVRYSPNTIDVPETPSLYAFSPWHGNLHKLLTRIMTERKTTSFVYADNWYIAYWEDEKCTWFSLDQEKAEAQLQYDDVRALAYYLMTRGHVTEGGAPRFGLTWFYIVTQMMPAFLHDPIGMLKNFQFKIPGMGSGISWTFLLNHARTAILDRRWRSMGMPKPGSPAFESKILLGAKSNLKIELELPDLERVMNDVKLTTPDDGIMQSLDPEADYPSDLPVKSVKLDLLGWSAAWSHGLQQWVPVLDDDRFYASLMLPTKDDRYDYKDRPWARYEYLLAAKTAMLVVGGWRFRPIFRALTNVIEEVRRKLGRLGKLDNESLAETFARTEFGAEIGMPPDFNYTKPLNNSDYYAFHLPDTRSRAEYVATWAARAQFRPAARFGGSADKQVNVPGVSFLANMRIQDYLANKDLLGRELTPEQLRMFLMSDPYREAIAERQSLVNFARVEEPLPHTRADKEPDLQKASNPFPSYQVHSKYMSQGNTAFKTGAGPTTGAPARLSKGQRKRQNKAMGATYVTNVIEDKGIPETFEDLQYKRKLLEDKKRQQAAERFKAKYGEELFESQPQEAEISIGEPEGSAAYVPKFKQTNIMHYKPVAIKQTYTMVGGTPEWAKKVKLPDGFKELKSSEIIQLDFDKVVEYIVHYYVKYGMTEKLKLRIKTLTPDELQEAKSMVRDDHGNRAVEDLFKFV